MYYILAAYLVHVGWLYPDTTDIVHSGLIYDDLNEAIERADRINRCDGILGRFFVVHESELKDFGLPRVGGGGLE